MPEIVSFDEDRNLVHVRAFGADTIEDWQDFRAQVLALCDEHQVNTVLVDAREQESAPSTGEIFEFGKAWPHKLRCAILVGEKTRPAQEFLETIAFNRAKQMRVFETETDALLWLRQ